MEIRRLRADEGARLRDVRLRALGDAPYAFSSWLEREAAYDEELWERRAAQSELGEDGVTFVAVENERCLGMASGFFTSEERETAILVGMWVEPGARRRGMGQALVEAVAAWARGLGARRLRADVIACEEAGLAASFYRNLGFEDTGELEHPESNRPLTALVILRSL